MTEQRGDRIPGSKYVRDFCAGCGEPIRVTDIKAPNVCDECSGAAHPSIWIASPRRIGKGQRPWRELEKEKQ